MKTNEERLILRCPECGCHGATDGHGHVYDETGQYSHSLYVRPDEWTEAWYCTECDYEGDFADFWDELGAADVH